MDDDRVQNLDSFVDIVANTAGMLIVLVVFVIMLSGKKGVEVDPQLMLLSNLNRQRSELDQTNEEFARQVESAAREHEQVNATLHSALSAMNLSDTEAARIPEMVGAAKEEAQSLSASLSRLENEAEAAGLELDRARAEVAREFPPEQIEELEAIELDALELGVSGLRAEIEALRARAAEQDGEREAVRERIEELVAEAALLEAQGGPTLAIVDPGIRTERGRRIVWAECFVPSDAEGPAVRLLTEGNYRRTESGLEPSAAGESAATLLEEESEFRRHLNSLAADLERADDLCVVFLVRPDAYSGFRVARKVARDLGWRVDWRPLEAVAR